MNLFLVITTINKPNNAISLLASGCRENNLGFIIVGDRKTPDAFDDLPGSTFLSLKNQSTLGLRYAELCPVDHYARKNIGYLYAIMDGARVIKETDDDNIPLQSFFIPPSANINSKYLDNDGWINVYSYFSDTLIWPRGLPLDEVMADHKHETQLPIETWSYKADPSDTRHVGPMAQDFKEIMGGGSDGKAICGNDAIGISLAAIKQLIEENKQLKSQGKALKTKVTTLETLLATVLKRLEKLEGQAQ